MASPTPRLLPGQSSPLTIITSDDQSGVVLIATSVGLIFGFVSLFIRVFIRLEFHHRFAKDDLFAGIAGIFSALQATAVFVAVSNGFGKKMDFISPSDLLALQKASYTSDILYIFTLWLTKCSVALLFLRISPDRGHTITSNMILLVSTVAMFVSIVMIGLRCDYDHPWLIVGQKCDNLWARWQAVAAFDILTELVLFSTSIYLVKDLRLSIKKKAIVVFAFGLRLPVIIPAIFRVHYLSQELSSVNPTIDGVLSSTLTQVHISYALIASTIPCLRPFMTALSTNYGAPGPNSAKPSPLNSKNVSSSAQDLSVSLRKLSRGGSMMINRADAARLHDGNRISSLAPEAGNGDGAIMQGNPTVRWDRTEHHAEVTRGDPDQVSIRSHESKQMIISKNTEWAVDFEQINIVKA